MSTSANSQINPQLLQQRLNVREQEINALKLQNRHLLGKMEELERLAKPNQVNTQFVADEVQKYLAPIISQLQGTITSSFEILQGTMRGIYQQSQRAQQAVEEMTTHSQDLELRMNEQRKVDQNFYQDKIFSMVSTFCDRMERQIDVRLKSLSVIELMNAKQNEVLSDMESMKGSIALMQKNSEASRGEVSRIERNAAESNEKLIDVQVQSQNMEELVRDGVQQIQNHRAESKVMRAEIRSALELLVRLSGQIDLHATDKPVEVVMPNPVPPSNPLVTHPITVRANEVTSMAMDEHKVINDLIEGKQRELDELEKNIKEQSQAQSNDDATLILSMLRAQKTELKRVADESKNYLSDSFEID